MTEGTYWRILAVDTTSHVNGKFLPGFTQLPEHVQGHLCTAARRSFAGIRHYSIPGKFALLECDLADSRIDMSCQCAGVSRRLPVEQPIWAVKVRAC